MTERRGQGPGDGDLDVDAAWAQIVAHWDQDDLRVVTDEGETVRPEGEPGPDDGETMTVTEVEAEDRSGAPAGSTPPLGSPPAPSGEVRPVGRSPHYPEEQDDSPGLGWDAIRSHVGGEAVRDSSRHDDDEGGTLAALDERFVPSDPPSLRPTDPVSALAWLGALGGPIFLLVAALAWRTAPSVLIGAAVLAFVAGFVTLVVRMPDEREDEDDGAVV